MIDNFIVACISFHQQVIDDFEVEAKTKLRARVEAPLKDEELLLNSSVDSSDMDSSPKRRAPRASEEQPLRPLEEIFHAASSLSTDAANRGGIQLRTLEQVRQLTGRPLDGEVVTLADNDDELFGPSTIGQTQATASSSTASASAPVPNSSASSASSASTSSSNIASASAQLPVSARRSGIVQLDAMAERVEAEFDPQNKKDGASDDDPLLKEVASLRSMFRDADPCYLQSVCWFLISFNFIQSFFLKTIPTFVHSSVSRTSSNFRTDWSW